MCAPRRCARTPVARRRLAAFIARRATRAGVSWTSRTASAPWVARFDHTSVIDYAGAIYVIGGRDDGTIYYHDVWVSIDGGARAGLAQGWSGVLAGY